VLEVGIPGVDGLEIQETLASRRPSLPVVFLTSNGTVSIAARAMRSGAVDFLEKPMRESDLWNAIREALRLDLVRWRNWQQQQRIEESLAKLTPKERLILSLIAQGESKLAMALEINASVRTVELHQARLRKKLGAKSTTQLVRFAVCAEDDGDSRQAEGPDHDFKSGHGAEKHWLNR
jgi:FixJ family two-component response regulator